MLLPRKHQSCLVAAVILLACGVAVAAPTPTYPCFRAAGPPVIDGIIEGDAAWECAPGVSGFHALGGGYTLAKQTTAFACYDDSGLYVAMLCEEPDIAEVKSVMKDGDDLWTEDGVEVFVQPVVAGPVYQFAVSAGGATRGAETASGVGGWQAAAHKGQDSYGIEASLPFSILGVAASEVASYRVAFCRNIWTYTCGGDKFTAWPALMSRFLEPGSFATLSFQPNAATLAQVAQAEARLNAAYRDSLMQQINLLRTFLLMMKLVVWDLA